MSTLSGKTLFITGASRGIGLAIALRAARDGANIAIAAKSAVPNPKLPGTIHTAAAEVEADYKVRYPWLVSKVGETPVAKEDPVATWLNRAWRSPVKEREFIESVPLGERLSTCANCQFYESSWPYAAEARRRRARRRDERMKQRREGMSVALRSE